MRRVNYITWELVHYEYWKAIQSMKTTDYIMPRIIEYFRTKSNDRWKNQKKA